MPQLTHRDVLLRGLRVHYVEAGSGPPLVLVHGFLVSHKEWRPLIQRLASHFRCIALDLPGCGASEKPPVERYPYTREAFAETVVELMRTLQLPAAHLCGHSMGGGVVLSLAADHAERVERVTLIDSACYRFPLPLKGRLPLLPAVGPLVFRHLYRRGVFRDYFRNEVFTGSGEMDLATVDEYYDDFSAHDARQAGHVMLHRSVTEVSSLSPKIPRVTAPTQLIWGAEDRIFPVGLAHRLVRELPDATLHVLERTGHAPNEERPDATADSLRSHHLGAQEP